MKPSRSRQTISSRQKGNALLFVLIGILLFAALSYTMTRTSRAPGQVSTEDARLAAQRMLSYAEKINGAVQNVMLQNGCLGSQVSFENSTVAGYDHAPAVSTKCRIFDLAGGGRIYEPPPVEALDTTTAGNSDFDTGALVGEYFFTGNVCVDNAGSGPHATCASDGLTNEELLLIVPWVKLEVCALINKTLGNTATMLVDASSSFDDTKFTGTFADGYAIGANGFTTYQNGCYKSGDGITPDEGYHFYYTLLAR